MGEEAQKPTTPPKSAASGEEKPEDAAANGGEGEAPAAPTPEPLGDPPEGVKPLFIPKTTKELYKIMEGEHVSEEKPDVMVSKATILEDIQFRGAISEMKDFKTHVQAYPEDELLFVFDDGEGCAGRVFGENFVVCFTLEAKDWMLRLLEEKERKKNEPEKVEGEEGEEEEEIPIPPLRRDIFYPQEYTQVNDEEVFKHLTVTESRPKIKFSFSRKRGEFEGDFKFSDRDAQDWCTDFRSYRDQNFELRRMELEKGVQAVPPTNESRSQTTWFRKQNRAIEYSSLELEEEKAKEVETDEEFAKFMQSTAPKVIDALKQNETIDVFFDEFSNLAEDDATVGGKGEQELQECYSFTYMHGGDGQGDKEKPCIGCIDWFPGKKDVVAVSLVSSAKLDDRLEEDGKIKKSYILIWNFADQINPELVLEAPADVHSFKFHPENEDMIVAGLANGQVIVYELKEARLEAIARKKGKKDGSSQAAAEVPTVKHVKMSTIEGSHKKDVTDLQWLPKDTCVKAPYGKRVDSEDAKKGTKQFITTSFDGQVMIWDLHYMKKEKDPRKEKPDLVWVPIYKCQLSFNDGTAGKRETGVTRFVLPEDVYKTSMFCVSDMGELVKADWIRREGEEGESNNIVDCNPLHINPCIAVQRTPLLPMPDLYLTVGDGSFCIYKEGIAEPLFRSRHSLVPLTAGLWSPTRHGVVFVAKADGSIDIWDLLDRSHEPSMTINVSSFPLTSLSFWNVKSTSQQLVAVGDSNGTLFVLDVPRNLRRPLGAEESIVKTYVDREISRVDYCRDRMDVERGEAAELAKEQAEREAKEAEEAAKAQAAAEQQAAQQQASGVPASAAVPPPTAPPADEFVIDEKEEAQYKELEKNFWMELGLPMEGQEVEA